MEIGVQDWVAPNRLRVGSMEVLCHSPLMATHISGGLYTLEDKVCHLGLPG